MADQSAIVIDAGTTMFRCGYAGYETIHAQFPPIIGSQSRLDRIQRSTYIGDEATVKMDILNPKTPFKRAGRFANFDDLERLLEHTYYSELRVEPEKQNVVQAMPVLSTHQDRCKVAQINFEKFNTPGAGFPDEALLTAYAQGRFDALSIVLGEEVSYVAPVVASVVKPGVALHVGGKSLTKHLLQLLNSNCGCGFAGSTKELQVVRDIKEKFGFAWQEVDSTDDTQRNYELPDGNVIVIGEERLGCTNPLFDPKLVGLEDPGLHQAIHDVNLQNPTQIAMLLNSICISGATAQFPGLVQRIEAEVKALTPRLPVDRFQFRNFSAPSEVALAVWIGGSIFGSLSSQPVILKTDYFEHGDSVLLRTPK